MNVNGRLVGKEHSMPGSESPPSEQTLLCVADNRELIDLFALVLKPAGYTVSGALTVRESLEQIERDKPQIVLLDLTLETWQLLDDGDFTANYERRRDTAGFPAPLGSLTVLYDRRPWSRLDPHGAAGFRGGMPPGRPGPDLAPLPIPAGPGGRGPSLSAGAMAPIPTDPVNLDLRGKFPPEVD